ncbi:hypothetical protein [Methylopila sp. 73B]|uniref:hypothetical protein n=1 Tax=Methylopila sp. 73B TaxID=1120792 RepID=UPI000367C02E|nr:hypothetical protein [Methylopila sp. 73B]
MTMSRQGLDGLCAAQAAELQKLHARVADLEREQKETRRPAVAGDALREKVKDIVERSGFVNPGVEEEAADDIFALFAAREAAAAAALHEAEAFMSIVEPRSDKAECLRILAVIRNAITVLERAR